MFRMIETQSTLPSTHKRIKDLRAGDQRDCPIKSSNEAQVTQPKQSKVILKCDEIVLLVKSAMRQKENGLIAPLSPTFFILFVMVQPIHHLG